MSAVSVHSAIRAWMFDAALPLWAEHGLDRQNGGYVEQMDFNGRDAGLDFKRTRVAGRQIYVFSHAAMLGWSEGNRLAEPGMEFLTQRAWLGPDRGFARTLTRSLEVRDTTPDLYDHAFVLFGLAWRHKAMKDGESLLWMHRTLDYIEAHLKHPSGLGYWHEVPAKGWRQQNPHMHLTEAFLAAYDASGDKRFADVALSVVDLFRTKLFDLKSGTMAEYFTDDWSRAPGDDGRLVEPGHLMEWAWILNSARKLLGVDTAPEIRAAIRFAETYGVDPVTGTTHNGVRDDGMPIDKGSRAWPNAERLKAAVALHELDGVDPTPVIESTGRILLTRYLGREPAGTWTDAFDAEGRQLSKTVPTSTLYHIFLAFAEVLRISDRAPAKG